MHKKNVSGLSALLYGVADIFIVGMLEYLRCARSGYNNNPDEIQLRIDPMNADLDEEVSSLRSKISLLKNISQEIGNEAKYQNDLISQL
ncbi:hypothetical protein MKX03_037183, partial [Papaver bracteatum]